MTEHSLETVRLDVVESLHKAIREKDSPFRTPVMASVDAEGKPQARVLVLRHFEPKSMTLQFFTDARSPKVSELKQTPHVHLVFYNDNQKIHFRVEGHVTLHTRDSMTEAMWSEIPEFGRGDYLTQQPPGAKIQDPTEGWQTDDEFGSENFMVIEVKIESIDWLKLSASGHRRARLIWRDGVCDGRWVTP